MAIAFEKLMQYESNLPAGNQLGQLPVTDELPCAVSLPEPKPLNGQHSNVSRNLRRYLKAAHLRTFGERLGLVMHYLNITNEHLGRLMGYQNEKKVQRWIENKELPDIAQLLALPRFFHLSCAAPLLDIETHKQYMKTLKTPAQRIIYFMDINNWSATWYGRCIGISARQVHQLRNGLLLPGMKLMLKVSRKFKFNDPFYIARGNRSAKW